MTARLTFAALVAAAVLPAAAFAAPNRSATVAAIGDQYAWSSDVQTGAVVTSTVGAKVPACSPVFSCDTTLIRTDTLGDLAVDVAGQGVGGAPTLQDIDLHVYASDADGTQGDLLGEGTSATPDEAVLVEDATPGYYLVKVDWYLGIGSFDGTAALREPVVEDDSGV